MRLFNKPKTPDLTLDLRDPRRFAKALWLTTGEDFCEEVQEALYELLNPDY